MDLWIRSQRRTILCKASTLRVGVNAFLEWCVFNELNDELGAYESEERALAILDEIQNYFKGTPIVKFSRMGDKQYMENIRDLQDNGFVLVEDTMDIIPAETKVYEMPKE